MLNSLMNLHRFFSTHPLTRENPLAAWGRFAAWQIESRARREVVVPWIGGLKLALSRGMSGATGNIYAGLHEFPDMAFLLHFLRPGDVFLDIGANIGSYTLLAAGVRGAETLAFEPDPQTFDALLRNISLNGLDERARAHRLALGEARRDVPFTVGLGPMNKVSADGAAVVRQERLDDAIGDRRPVMIKIDVEGHEEAVLTGAAETLTRESLKALEIETVTPSLAQTLAAHGFERAFYDPFCRRLAREPGRYAAANALYLRDWAFVERRLAGAEPIEVLGQRI